MTHDQNLQDFRKGNELFAQGHSRRAERIADSLIGRKFSGGYELKARCLYERGQHEEAIVVLEDSVKRYPSVCILWSYLGEYYSNDGKYQDALAAFHQYRNAGGDDDSANYNLAITYGRMGDFEMALRHIDLVGVDVDRHHTLEAKAWFLAEVSDLAGSIEHCDMALAEAPESSFAHAQRALALQGLGRNGDAVAAARRALELDSSQEAALRVMCMQNSLCDAETRVFKIVFNAEPKKGVEPMPGLRVDGLFGVFWAAAKSPEAALAYYRELVDSGDKHSYSISEATVEQEAIDGHEGVWRVDPTVYSYAIEGNPIKRFGLYMKAIRWRPRE
jgi:tetratricopeptide (TPR) repeat protein